MKTKTSINAMNNQSVILVKLSAIYKEHFCYNNFIVILIISTMIEIRLGTRFFNLVQRLNQKLAAVTDINLRSIKEILKLTTILKAENPHDDPDALIHQAFINYYQNQLPPKVNGHK